MAERRVLVLGGTGEALDLVRRIAGDRSQWRPILSLAGRTRAPQVPEHVAVRIGGFGGAEGLCDFLASQEISLLVDATHPFAPVITRNAREAARAAGVRLLRLDRPAWRAEGNDRWTPVADEREAASRLASGSRPFIALGRQHLAPFLARTDLAPLLRMVDPPDFALPAGARLVLGRPAMDWEEEAALMRTHAVDRLVCRNSGGAQGFAKVHAARRLDLPVLMIERPPHPPDVDALASVEAVLERL